MIDNLKDSLKEWYDKHNLVGLYIVGSFSLNEDNVFSDIDTLGLSQRKFSPNEIIDMREELKYISKTKFNSKKIGFRVRTSNEILQFQYKAKSWGYDLNESKRIFGLDLKSVIKKTRSVSINKKEIFDNLIEKSWYDLLFIDAEKDQIKINYLCAKALIILTNFYLYHNEIFLKTDESRINYLKNNKNLIQDLPITIDILEKALTIKKNPTKYNSDLGLNKRRYNLLKALYRHLLPSFNELSDDFGVFNYWTYNSDFFAPINQIYRNISPPIKSLNIENNAFLWRIVLIEVFLKLDKNSDLTSRCDFITHLNKIIFSQNLDPTQESYTIDKYKFLRKLEKIRIQNSVIGYDFAKKKDDIKP